ncbi:hypothetical protein CY35_14G040000, partial [Sphagnum magellanicum]
MLQPICFEVHGKGHQVCKLKKAPRAWRNHANHNLYYNILAKEYCVILILYGDDVFSTRDDDHKLFMVEEELEKHYEMSRLNLTKFNIKFLYFIEGKMLIQCRYARLILHRYQMANCHPISTTMEEW